MSRFATTFPRRAGTVARVARRTPFMIPSPLVPVEGALARPRINPLDQVPPFGREWRFLGAPGARSSKNCLATLTTSCIDVDWPHSACRWQPLPASALPASGGLPAPPAAAAGRRLRHRRPRDRRAMYALYWSIGALGIIGWLIGTYDPPAGFGPAYAIQATGGGRSRHDVDRHHTYGRDSPGHLDERRAAAQGRGACREHDENAARHALRPASPRIASSANGVRHAARRACVAPSGSRPAHDAGTVPHTGRAATRRTSADPACAAPARCDQHRHTRSARSTAAHGRHARYTRLARRSGHADRHGERAARHAAGPPGAPERGRFRLDIATVAPSRDRRAGRVRALTPAQ